MERSDMTERGSPSPSFTYAATVSLSTGVPLWNSRR